MKECFQTHRKYHTKLCCLSTYQDTLIKIFAVPLLRKLGSRLEYMILIGFPLIGVKLSISNARTIGGAAVVDVGVAERPPRVDVPADAHGDDAADLREDVEELRVLHADVEIPDVERGRREGGGRRRSGRGGGGRGPALGRGARRLLRLRLRRRRRHLRFGFFLFLRIF
ncbi:Os09g0115466, partial [Oryza sativa Japonica Group]